MDLKNILIVNDLFNRSICLHSSFKSFGLTSLRPEEVISSFLETGNTLLVPSFSYSFAVSPPKNDVILRNGMSEEWQSSLSDDNKKIFSIDSEEISKSMGIIPRLMVSMEARSRGYHPINSFTAIGPNAHELVHTQTPLKTYEPIRKLIENDGLILLMGVDLTTLTAIHLAQEISGKTLFFGWANNSDGVPSKVRVGTCSKGFSNLSYITQKIEKKIQVGNSMWRIFNARQLVEQVSKALCNQPGIVLCGSKGCVRCRDYIQGGPIVTKI